MKYNIPKIMIAADKSGCGKTAFCALLVHILIERKLKPAVFKCGPDYLDPLFHERINGIKPGNLDSFFCNEKDLAQIFYNESKGCDIALCEGVMGYYDGKGSAMEGSTAGLADILKMPVVLVVDAKGTMQSSLAVIKGFLTYHEYGKNIKAVVLNRTGKKVFDALQSEIENLGVATLGYIENTKELSFPSRYLGVETPKDNVLRNNIQKAAERVHVDVDRLVEIAGEALETEVLVDEEIKDFSGVTVAVAKDEAFCFIYKENIEMMESLGVKVKYFSPIKDRKIPNADAMILPGGYPEDYAAELSANKSMMESIKAAVISGIPTIAECGGYLYLHKSLITVSGEKYELAGLIEGSAKYKGLCKGFGYKEISKDSDWLLGERGQNIKGHEFHHFVSDANPVFGERLYAGFCHIPFAGNRNALYRFLEAAS